MPTAGRTSDLLVACLDPNDGAVRSGNDNDDTNDDAKVGPECNASVRIKLKEGVVLTLLAPVDGEWLLASTSRGRLWKIYKESSPVDAACQAGQAQDDR